MHGRRWLRQRHVRGGAAPDAERRAEPHAQPHPPVCRPLRREGCRPEQRWRRAFGHVVRSRWCIRSMDIRHQRRRPQVDGHRQAGGRALPRWPAGALGAGGGLRSHAGDARAAGASLRRAAADRVPPGRVRAQCADRVRARRLADETPLRPHRLRLGGTLQHLGPEVAQLELGWRPALLDTRGVDGLRLRVQVRHHAPQLGLPAAVPLPHGPLQPRGHGPGGAVRAVRPAGGRRGGPARGARRLGGVLGDRGEAVPDVPHPGGDGGAGAAGAGARRRSRRAGRLLAPAAAGLARGRGATRERPLVGAAAGARRPRGRERLHLVGGRVRAPLGGGGAGPQLRGSRRRSALRHGASRARLGLRPGLDGWLGARTRAAASGRCRASGASLLGGTFLLLARGPPPGAPPSAEGQSRQRESLAGPRVLPPPPRLAPCSRSLLPLCFCSPFSLPHATVQRCSD
mmetsp:Transcript_79618/g.213888  ORF Transcript_79618/g.213888 Transcript_79618/m.213888 type:complete len:457 (+) Transcript_79618:1236-2606(+)